MSSVPTVVKVLQYLVNTTSPSTYNDISRAVQEGQALVDKALAELMARGLVDRRGRDYSYRASPEADELCRKMLALYDRVMVSQRKELLVRGLLSLPGLRCLWRVSKLLDVVEKEGLAREDIIPFLDEEVRAGYVSRAKIMFVARIPFTAPPFIPYYRIDDFRGVEADEYEQMKEQCARLGLSIKDEQYVAGTYPAEIAQPAVRYLEREKRQLRDILKEDAFQEWPGLTYSW